MAVVDLYFVYNFIRKLTTPFKEWSAFENEIIDEKGNILKKRRTLKTIKERESFTLFDLMVLNIKKQIDKIPGSQSLFGSATKALFLLKETTFYAENMDRYGSNEELLAETFSKKIVNQLMLTEEAPTNMVGGGNIAGVGVGEFGTPPVGKAVLLRRRKRKKKKEEEKEL